MKATVPRSVSSMNSVVKKPFMQQGLIALHDRIKRLLEIKIIYSLKKRYLTL